MHHETVFHHNHNWMLTNLQVLMLFYLKKGMKFYFQNYYFNLMHMQSLPNVAKIDVLLVGSAGSK